MTGKMTDNDFKFSGLVYVRPCGRGISLVNDSGWQLEDLLEENEYYMIEVRAKKVSEGEVSDPPAGAAD